MIKNKTVSNDIPTKEYGSAKGVNIIKNDKSFVFLEILLSALGIICI